MTDIVERLRDAKACTQKTLLHSPDWRDGRKVLDEAIDEIKRLRAALSSPGPLSKGEDFRSWWERGLPRS